MAAIHCNKKVQLFIDGLCPYCYRLAMRTKKPNTDPGKIYVGARVPRDLKKRLTRRAKREHRSEAAVIELMLTKELAIE
jgi:hypothetical protein